jgi:hypothetical protein
MPILFFVSTFHSTREALISQGDTYKMPSFEAFCDSLIREQDKLLHLGVINTTSTSNKALVAQQKDKGPKHPKKQHPQTTNKTRVPNPLNQLLLPMVIKELNQKARRLRDIVIFVGEMVIWSLNVSRRWKP